MGSESQGGNSRAKELRPIDNTWRTNTKEGKTTRVSPEKLRKNMSDSLMFHLSMRDTVMSLTKASDIKVLMVLAEQTYGWHRSFVYAPARLIAKRANLSIEAVRSSLKHLEKSGVITRQRVQGGVPLVGFVYVDPEEKPESPSWRPAYDGGHNTAPARRKPVPF